MTSTDQEHNWIHRVTRQIVRAIESPGPEYEKLRDPWEHEQDLRRVGPAPALPPRLASAWIHRVTRQTQRSEECPGPDFTRIPEPTEAASQQANRRDAIKGQAIESEKRSKKDNDEWLANPLRYGLEDK